jgi:hypothetical protein
MLFFYCSLILLVLYYFSMSSYGRNRNSASSYQFRSRAGYASGSFAPKGARRYTPKTAAARRYGAARKPGWKPKFATVAYSRDVETKYSDKAIQGAGTNTMTQASDAGGFGHTSTVWRTINFGGSNVPLGTYVQDLFKGVPQDTTVNGRVGNKINVKCVKLKITATASHLRNTPVEAVMAQYGESVIVDDPSELRQYLRTTFRVLVVKDTQVNSQNNVIAYDDVMEVDPATGFAGVHSELKIANMGRFKILTDKIFTLDADDPQKTLSLSYYNLGQVRYNATQAATPPQTALTDVGLYVVFASWVQGGWNLPVANSDRFPVALPVNVSRRLCFTDL